jgi:hypothetical protein
VIPTPPGLIFLVMDFLMCSLQRLKALISA